MFDVEVEVTDSSFIIKDQNHVLIVQEWGENAVRVIDSPVHHFTLKQNNGMHELEKNNKASVSIKRNKNSIEFKNNDLTVIYDGEKLVFYHQSGKVLEEFSRKQSKVRRTIGIDNHIKIPDLPTSSLAVSPREFSYQSENSYRATVRFEGDLSEKIYGLGGYQEKNLNKNAGTYELMQRNSQTSIPFYISNKNYSFIWNNASVGEVSFSRNQKKWHSNQTEYIDYIVTVGENPKELLTAFTKMTGRTPEISSDLLGLWQSKLRYQTLDELKKVYEGYRQRGINLSVLVIDYFHWTADGDFEFDQEYWAGIEEFAQELKENGTKLMVSLWPTVTDESKYYKKYQNNQLFIRGTDAKNDLFDGKEILDFSNPKTADHLEDVLNKNYRQLGIELFWADQAEPEMTLYNHKNYLVHEGNFEKYANRYPVHYLQAVQNGEVKLNPVLIRSAWFNAQKHGALVWSGDIESSFDSLARQIQVSISMGLSGISWWTSDIAGFHSGDSTTEAFKELMIRWFQYATFSPILRMHGDRQPHTQRIGDSGGGLRTSGGPNEIWSFGEEVETIVTKFIRIRENLQDYIQSLYEESSASGHPIIRSLFYEFPEDEKTWEETTNYMFGHDLLVAPVTAKSLSDMTVYLPEGVEWIEVFTGKHYSGGTSYTVPISLDSIPVFCRASSELSKEIKKIF